MMPIRIEIVGGIASGKTTLARALSATDMHVQLESFEKNPFFEAFYSDPVENAFETEITFLLQHYHQLRSITNHGADRRTIADFGFPLDCAYAELNLTGDAKSAFYSVLEVAQARLGPPNLILRLHCRVQVEHTRIMRRGRAAETAISRSYLESLETMIDQVMETRMFAQVPTLAVDTDSVDYRTDKAAIQCLKAEISSVILDCRGAAEDSGA